MRIERTAGDLLIEAAARKPALLLTGARKTGKSSLLKHLFPNAEHIRLDRSASAFPAFENPRGFLRKLKNPCILDNIEYTPFLLEEIKNICLEHPGGAVRWILTSNHITPGIEQILKEFYNSLKIIELTTLSARELRSTWISSQDRVHYCWKGGYPDVWSGSSPDTARFFDEYLQTFTERDVRSLIQVKNLIQFQKFLRLCAHSVGGILNYAETARKSEVSANTVKAWISALARGGIIQLLPCSQEYIHRRLVKSPKLYFSDNGFLCYLLGISSSGGLHAHPLKEVIWKNITFCELFKPGSWVPGKNLFYYRDQNGVEIDFILRKGRETILVLARTGSIPHDEVSYFSRAGRAYKRSVVTYYASSMSVQSNRLQEQGYKSYNPLFQSL